MHIKYDVSDNLLNNLGKWITKFETISRVGVKCYWGGPLRVDIRQNIIAKTIASVAKIFLEPFHRHHLIIQYTYYNPY